MFAAGALVKVRIGGVKRIDSQPVRQPGGHDLQRQNVFQHMEIRIVNQRQDAVIRFRIKPGEGASDHALMRGGIRDDRTDLQQPPAQRWVRTGQIDQPRIRMDGIVDAVADMPQFGAVLVVALCYAVLGKIGMKSSRLILLLVIAVLCSFLGILVPA